MKQRLLIRLFTICLLFFSCTSTGGGGASVPMDQAIQTAADTIEDGLQKGVKIAAINFNSPSEQFSSYVLDELSGHLVNRRNLVVVDRAELDLIRREEQFQMSGEVSDESALSIGQKLGAQFIVSGGLSSLGNTYRFRIRVLNVETTAVEVFSASNLDAKDKKLAYLLSDARSTTETAPVLERTRSMPTKIYKIGDTGPAGGIVFFDKGVYESGWRYLETAPHDFPDAKWGTYGIDVGGTKTDVGSGKKNTELIVQKLKEQGEQGRAAQICRAFEAEGYTDWFLPSIDELYLIYRNLKLTNLVDFSDDLIGSWYWSSSEDTSRYAWGLCFDVFGGWSAGTKNEWSKNQDFKIRAVRYF